MEKVAFASRDPFRYQKGIFVSPITLNIRMKNVLAIIEFTLKVT